MKHLKFKPKKIIKIGRMEVDVTKHSSTTSVGNQLYIKKYKNGVAIRMRGQSEIIMTDYLAGDLALILREYSNPKMYTSIELGYIIRKFKYNKDVVDFVQRILDNKVTLDEIDKIREEQKVKEKVVDRLIGKERLNILFR